MVTRRSFVRILSDRLCAARLGTRANKRKPAKFGKELRKTLALLEAAYVLIAALPELSLRPFHQEVESCHSDSGPPTSPKPIPFQCLPGKPRNERSVLGEFVQLIVRKKSRIWLPKNEKKLRASTNILRVFPSLKREQKIFVCPSLAFQACIQSVTYLACVSDASSCCRNHERAYAQSFFTVATETPNSRAACWIVRPLKYRRRTICAGRAALCSKFCNASPKSNNSGRWSWQEAWAVSMSTRLR